MEASQLIDSHKSENFAGYVQGLSECGCKTKCEAVRQVSSLSVVIIHLKICLLRQITRDFFVQRLWSELEAAASGLRSFLRLTGSSYHPTGICIRYLLLAEFEEVGISISHWEEEYRA